MQCLRRRDASRIRFVKPGQFRTAGSLGLLLPLLLATGVCAGQADAQNASCFRTGELTADSGWNMQASGRTFQDGDVVGWVDARTQYLMSMTPGSTVQVMAQARGTSNAFNAEPLAGVPGLGLRVLWKGYAATANLTPITSPAAPGTIISDRSRFTLLEASAQTDYTLTELFKFELVVIDQKLYKGGRLSSTENGVMMFVTSAKAVASNPQMCVNGRVDAMSALISTLQVPKLPEPARPTCKFDIGSLNQRVSLGTVGSGQVAAYGSSRSAGQEGQGRFSIRASACNQGAVMSLYFTDNRSGSSTADYLSSSKNAVGVRLYFSDEMTPLSFGPAPMGSGLPARQAVTVGPVPDENIGVSMDFVAQYVRRPNMRAGDVTSGPVQAEAVFTIMYP